MPELVRETGGGYQKWQTDGGQTFYRDPDGKFCKGKSFAASLGGGAVEVEVLDRDDKGRFKEVDVKPTDDELRGGTTRQDVWYFRSIVTGGLRSGDSGNEIEIAVGQSDNIYSPFTPRSREPIDTAKLAREHFPLAVQAANQFLKGAPGLGLRPDAKEDNEIVGTNLRGGTNAITPVGETKGVLLVKTQNSTYEYSIKFGDGRATIRTGTDPDPVLIAQI